MDGIENEELRAPKVFFKYITDVAVLDPVSAHVEPIQRDNIFNSQR